MPASDIARRAASTTCAADASSPSARSSCGGAAEPARDRVVGLVEELVVPGGRVDAGAVAGGAREQPVGPRHPGRGDLDLGQALAACAGRARRGRGSVSAGACQAPQTTATFSACLLAARIDWRMYASRRSSRGVVARGRPRAARPSPRSRPRRRRPRGATRRRPPTSARGRRGRRPRPARPAGRRAGRGAARRRAAAILFAAGRSMKRTGTSWSSAWRIARHSGEKRANG